MAIDERVHRTNAPGRLRFVRDTEAVDLAVPADVAMVDVLGAVLSQFPGATPDERPGDWVVQRLGEPPLDQDRTPMQLNLLDGESLHLRLAGDPLPTSKPAGTTDDGEEAAAGPPSWSAANRTWAKQLGAAVAFLGGIGVLLAGTPAALQITMSGITAVGLLVTSVLVSLSGGNRRTATMLAAVATCYAAATGWLMVLATHPVADASAYWASAAAAAAVALCAGLGGAAHSAPVFTGGLTAIVLLVVPVTFIPVGSVSPPHAAAIGLVITLVVVLFVPGTAFRLGGMSLPILPTNADELREDIDPVPHGLVVARGAVTIKYLKGLHIGVGVAQCALLVVLRGEDGLAALWFTVAVALLLFLRARHLSSVVQRWAVLVPAGLATVFIADRLAAGENLIGRVLHVWVPVFAAGMVLLLLSTWLPGRRLKPYWLRAVDILESLTAVAVFPLLLGVLDVYMTMREMGS